MNLGKAKNVKAYLFTGLRRRVLEKIKREKNTKFIRQDLFDITDIQFSDEDFQLTIENQEQIDNILFEALNKLHWRQREAAEGT